MFPLLQVGPFSIPSAPLFLLVGFWLGVIASERNAAFFQADGKQISDLLWLGLVAGVVGARLAYVVNHLQVFLIEPLAIFSLRPGMMDNGGGVLIGILAVLIYAQKQRLSFWQTLDAITPALLLLSIAGGFALLANGEWFGVATRQPWGIALWGEQRHPTPIYWIIAACLTTGVLYPRPRTHLLGLWRADVAGSHFLLWVYLKALGWMLIMPFVSVRSAVVAGLLQPMLWLVQTLCLWRLLGRAGGAKDDDGTVKNAPTPHNPNQG